MRYIVGKVAGKATLINIEQISTVTFEKLTDTWKITFTDIKDDTDFEKVIWTNDFVEAVNAANKLRLE